MLANDYGIDGGGESKSKVHFEVVPSSTDTKQGRVRFYFAPTCL
jgi:hypothetical protein